MNEAKLTIKGSMMLLPEALKENLICKIILIINEHIQNVPSTVVHFEAFINTPKPNGIIPTGISSVVMSMQQSNPSVRRLNDTRFCLAIGVEHCLLMVKCCTMRNEQQVVWKTFFPLSRHGCCCLNTRNPLSPVARKEAFRMMHTLSHS